MNKEFIELLKSRVSIVDLVSKKTKLTRKGRDYFGICPFHSEKTGSFKVDPVKGFYYCFGCGKHGDIFNFVMECDNLPFNLALEKVASYADLEMPKATKKESTKNIDSNKIQFAILKKIQEIFLINLDKIKSGIIRDYLAMRGITEKDIKKFQIGYADKNIDIYSLLRKSSFSDADLINSGVFFCENYSGRVRNKFDGRLTFPIKNVSGKCIGFGGRSVNGELPKYLNSPETRIFKKKENLYAYDLAKTGTYKDLIIVEGYLDVISMHRAGFDKTVATLGTAIGEEQIDLCWRISDNPIILLDGDNAGIKAAYRLLLRIMPKLSPGKSFRFAIIPDGDDPDSIITTRGIKSMQDILDSAYQLKDWLWTSSFVLHPSETPEQKGAILESINSSIDTILNANIKYLYKKWFKEKKNEFLFSQKKYVNTTKINKVSSRLEKYQEILLALIIKNPHIIDEVIEMFSTVEFSNTIYDSVKCIILREYSEKNNIDDIVEKIYNSLDILSRNDFLFDMSGCDEHIIVQEWKNAYNEYLACVAFKNEIVSASENLEKTFSEDAWVKFKALKETALDLKNKKY